MFPTVAASLS